MTTQYVRSLEELRELIEKHNAWGMPLHEFRDNAGTRQEGSTTYITSFEWGAGSSNFQEIWDLVQYIHKFYVSKSS